MLLFQYLITRHNYYKYLIQDCQNIIIQKVPCSGPLFISHCNVNVWTVVPAVCVFLAVIKVFTNLQSPVLLLNRFI